MIELEITRHGKALGIALPSALLQTLHASEGDRLIIDEHAIKVKSAGQYDLVQEVLRRRCGILRELFNR